MSDNGTVGTLREQVAEMRGEMKGMANSLSRIEGQLYTALEQNARAQKAQDDRLSDFAVRLGQHEGERSAGAKFHDWARLISTGIASAVATVLATVFATHVWGK